MVLPRETIGNGAPNTCPDCGVRLVPKVMSTCGYYIGTECNCGPYSRESEYFKTFKEAEDVLKGMIYGRVNPAPPELETGKPERVAGRGSPTPAPGPHRSRRAP